MIHGDARRSARVAASFENRSSRLAFFGIVAILVGALWLLLALASIGLALLPIEGTDARSMAMGAGLYSLIAAAFAWCGVGSLQRRRWAPPLMRILAWTWFLGGLLGLLIVPRIFGAAVDEFRTPMMIVSAIAVGIAGIALPALFIRVYGDPDAQATCDAADPAPGWTDRCPVPVLGLSVGLGVLAAMALPLALRSAVPLFGTIVTGAGGAALIVTLGAACAWLARSTYRLQPSGWWITTILVVAIGLSTWVTFRRVEPAELYRRMGYADAQLEILGKSGMLDATWINVATVVFTIASVAYMAAIRRYFGGSEPKADAT